MYYTEAMHDPLTVNEFMDLWKLEFGYEWVYWFTGVAFKENLIGRNSFQLLDLANAGRFERKVNDNVTYLRLLK